MTFGRGDHQSTDLVVFAIFQGAIDREVSELLFFVIFIVILSGMPVAIGVALLKHRLYEIDLLINCTLVYGALTALLVAV